MSAQPVAQISPLLLPSFSKIRIAASALALGAAVFCGPLTLTTVSPAFAQQGQQAKTFALENENSEMIRLAETLKTRAGATAAAKPLAEHRRDAAQARERNNMIDAIAALARALTLAPNDSGLWMEYARASYVQSQRDSNRRWAHLGEAVTAAYTAYQRASTPAAESVALNYLAALYAHRANWRQSLNTYKASLAITDNPETRKVYEALRAKHGFRITGYKIDSDLVSPRACFQFSETLKTKTDFTPFIAVAGSANAAITTEDQQICIEGLTHGQRYSVVIRQGLPSNIEEDLLRSADYEIFVKDRSPAVRFTGKNFVLPRTGQEGIPVVSTNTSRIALDVLRIGDRSLLPTIRSEEFLSQLGGYRLREIIEGRGVKVWSGTLDVKEDRNKDVITAFPILDAVKKMEPGVYILAAVAGDKPVSQRISENEDFDEGLSTQWFVVSDLGLTAFSGIDGVNVLVRSLANAQPMQGIEVRLVARNNEVLGTARTDARGIARFDPGLARGTAGLAPGLITASTSEGDYNFLDLVQTSFDLTDRGVKGRPAAQALDAFVYTERGVYRSGETVNISAILRDARGEAAAGLPLTLVVRRPDGVEYRRVQINDQGLGGRALPLALVSSAPTGTWRVQAYADPKSPMIGQATFLVEDYVPERLDVTVTPKEKMMTPGESTSIEAAVRFLYGAPGAGLEVTGEVIVQATRRLAIPGYEDYSSGLADQEFETIKNEIDDKETTDEKGIATIEAGVPEIETTRPLEARIIIRAAEPGGRAVERTLTLPIKPSKPLIALKPNFGELREGMQATFSVVTLSDDGDRIAAKGLRWTLSRVTNSYQWYNSDGRWAFERVKASRKVAEGEIATSAGELATLSAPVRWGNYRLDIVSPDGSLTPVGYTFSTGWSGEATSDTPDLLEVTLDKKDYRAGERMKVRVLSRFDGKATIAIVGDRLREVVLADLKTGDNDIEIPVAGDWGASAYAVAFAHRPLDSQARRMPSRALGLAWFSVEAASRKIGVSIDMPDKVAPRQAVKIPVQLTGLAAGEEAYVTVAAVDVGILNITRYQTPDPTSHFYGQRQLTTEIRDIYGLLIDGMQGSRGAIRQGGDAAGAGNEGNRPTQEPLARFSGVVRANANGVAEVTFDLPAFNGTMRVMAVAWSKSRSGHVQKDVIVRDAVVAQATLPRFLNFGDRSQFHIQLDNVDGRPGDYTVDFDVRGPVAIAATALRRTVRLEEKGRASFSIPVSGAGTGLAEMTMRVTGPGFDAAQNFVLSVKPGTSELYRRMVRMVQPGETITVSNDLIADFLPGTGAISVAASPLGAIDVPALLQALDRYPYGCSEQIVSRAMPLLYLSQLAPAGRLGLDEGTRERVQTSIERVMARQDSTGSFGLWSSENANDLWLDAFVTDFLTRARENNFQVPQRGFEQALDQLRNQVVNTNEVTATNAAAIAYSIYVLARNGRPIMGDLRYLADAKMNVFATPLARAQIAAALALLGDKGRAASAFQSAGQQLAIAQSTAFSRPDYGSLLRDAAGVLALGAEAGADQSLLLRASQRLQEAQGATRFTSTQEQNWMVLAASALTKQAQNMALTIDGQAHKGPWYANFRGLALDGRNVTIGNAGQTPAQVTITTSGNPAVREPAESQGYSIERSFYQLDGKPADLNTVRQNDRLVVVLKVTEPQALFARLLLVDKLPAGLEIDNARLVDSGSLSGLDWLKSEIKPEHAEYRDDRFVAAFHRNGSGKPAIFYAAYIVRAVTPGDYVLPPAVIEDMYRPERFGRTAYGALTIAPAQR